MATTIRQIETPPAAYPEGLGAGLSPAAAALDPAVIWSRLESWVSWRWSPRNVVWLVEGPGDWLPPLAPATISGVKVWGSDLMYSDVVLSPSAGGGLVMPSCRTYQVEAVVGGGSPAPTVPAAVVAAYRRLAEFMGAAPDSKPGATRHSVEIGGAVKISTDRAPGWISKAMHNSGAADLLRPYRSPR